MHAYMACMHSYIVHVRRVGMRAIHACVLSMHTRVRACYVCMHAVYACIPCFPWFSFVSIDVSIVLCCILIYYVAFCTLLHYCILLYSTFTLPAFHFACWMRPSYCNLDPTPCPTSTTSASENPPLIFLFRFPYLVCTQTLKFSCPMSTPP